MRKFGVLVAVFFLGLIFLAGSQSGAASYSCGLGLRPGDMVTTGYGEFELTEQRFAHANVIVRVGIANSIPENGQVIALAVALTEDKLDNPPDGDSGSAGIFQQIESWGWGTFEERTNPEIAAYRFYHGHTDSQGRRAIGLLDIDGWEAMSMGDAAHAVQQSLHPDRVKSAIAAAQRIHKGVVGSAGNQCLSTGEFADNVVAVTNGAGGTTWVDASIAPALQAMMNDAKRQGLILAGGGHRTVSSQIELRKAHCGTSDYAIYEMPSSQCRPPTARPGRSQHQLGLAVDFTCNGVLITYREGNPCYEFIAKNWPRYFRQTNNPQFIGWKNLASEPWHWSTTGN